jgi:hypothetical protein
VPNIKRSIEVRLNKKVSPAVLEAIAYEIKKLDQNNYQRTFIGYYLPDMQIGAGAWATTHFAPNIEVKILGATAEEEARLKTPAAKSDIVLGDWFCIQPPLDRRITLYKADNRIFMKRLIQDGSGGTVEMIEKKSDRGRQFESRKANAFGEYYLINRAGELEIWDRQGKILSCKPVGK